MTVDQPGNLPEIGGRNPVIRSKCQTFSLLLFPFLLLASLLSACQSGPTDQEEACTPQSLPIVKLLQPVQALTQNVYVTSGSNMYALTASNGTMRWCSAISAGNEQERFASVIHSGDKLYTFTE